MRKYLDYKVAGTIIRIIGVISLFFAIIGVITTIIFSAIFTGKNMPNNGLLMFVLILALVLVGIFEIYLGKSISEHKEWAKVAGLILAAVLILGFPIGTLIGIYVICCLTISWKIDIETPPADHNLIENKKKKTDMFATIEGKDDDLMAIKKSSIVIFFIAVLQIGLGRLHYLIDSTVIINPSLIFEAILCAILAGILLKWKSRVAAGLLLLLALFELVMACLAVLLWGPDWEANNIFFAMIIVIFAYRALKATSKLHCKSAS